MKRGRKPSLTLFQKEFVWENHQMSTQYLASLLDTSTATITRVKGEKGLQDKRFLRNPHPAPAPQVKTKPVVKPEPVLRNYRDKSDRYDKLKALSQEKGCRNVAEAIVKFGKKNLLRELA
jgi:hypothetical protein